MSGTLYICATPIGNLQDMTLRVMDTLKMVDLIAAEDTRNSIKLLNAFDIHTPMTSYHEFNKFEKAEELVQTLQKGKNIAIITDAGTPGISDPGEVLVARCVEENIPVTSLPGSSAVITALTISGLSTRRFVFEGFLSRENKERKEVLREIAAEHRTMVLYEAPHHLKNTLKDLCAVLPGERRIALCRELTKKHEEVIRLTLAEAVQYFEENDPRGEFVLVLEGLDKQDRKAEEQQKYAEMPLVEHMNIYLEQGMDRKDAMKAVAKDRGVSKRDVYNELLKIEEEE